MGFGAAGGGDDGEAGVTDSVQAPAISVSFCCAEVGNYADFADFLKRMVVCGGRRLELHVQKDNVREMVFVTMQIDSMPLLAKSVARAEMYYKDDLALFGEMQEKGDVRADILKQSAEYWRCAARALRFVHEHMFGQR